MSRNVRIQRFYERIGVFEVWCKRSPPYCPSTLLIICTEVRKPNYVPLPLLFCDVFAFGISTSIITLISTLFGFQMGTGNRDKRCTRRLAVLPAPFTWQMATAVAKIQNQLHSRFDMATCDKFQKQKKTRADKTRLKKQVPRQNMGKHSGQVSRASVFYNNAVTSAQITVLDSTVKRRRIRTGSQDISHIMKAFQSIPKPELVFLI